MILFLKSIPDNLDIKYSHSHNAYFKKLIDILCNHNAHTHSSADMYSDLTAMSVNIAAFDRIRDQMQSIPIKNTQYKNLYSIGLFYIAEYRREYLVYSTVNFRPNEQHYISIVRFGNNLHGVYFDD